MIVNVAGAQRQRSAVVSMRFLAPHLFQRGLVRRTISIVTLTMYAALVFGLPLPAAVRKSGDEPYPCQNNPCGCLTAMQCWTSCCCTTPEERFAWARAHGITPPDYAERPAASPGKSERVTAKKSCCSKKKSCCETSSDDATPAHDANAPPKPTSKINYVLGVAAMKCQGLSSMSADAGLAPEPPAWFSFDPAYEPGDWLTSSSIAAVPLSSPPSLPPPR